MNLAAQTTPGPQTNRRPRVSPSWPVRIVQ